MVELLGGEVSAFGLDDLECGVTEFATAGRTNVNARLGALHHLRGVEACGTLGDDSLGGLNAGEAGLGGLEFSLAGFELVQGGRQAGVLLFCDFLGGGKSLDFGLESRNGGTELFELHLFPLSKGCGEP